MLAKIKTINSVDYLKKAVVSILLFLSLFTCFSFNNTVTSYAEGQQTTNLDGLGVEMADDGITIKGNGFESQSTQAWNTFFLRYKKFIVGGSGIATLTMVGIFIVMFVKLGASAGNEKARKEAISGIMWSGVATAGMGAVTLIVSFFYSSLKGDVTG